jgi:hypothetical protein
MPPSRLSRSRALLTEVKHEGTADLARCAADRCGRMVPQSGVDQTHGRVCVGRRTVMIMFLGARAGRVWGLDGLILRKVSPSSRHWLSLIMVFTVFLLLPLSADTASAEVRVFVTNEKSDRAPLLWQALDEGENSADFVFRQLALPGRHAFIGQSVQGNFDKALLGTLKLFEIRHRPSSFGTLTVAQGTDLIVERPPL